MKIFTDIAGDSKDFPDRGIGAVIFPHVWCQILHGRATNKGLLDRDGRSLSHKISVWELVGPLLAFSSVPNKVRNKTALVLVDNMGSVYWWSKGWAKQCMLDNTILRALLLVTKALNCKLYLEHISRCSKPEAVVTDHISK